MDYSQLSDFEINKRVAEIIYRGFDINHPRELAVIQAPDNEADVVISTGSSREWRNYCHNPADAWPIIVENKITIHAPMHYEDTRKWLAFDVHNSDADFEDGNPLRAAMIVFLKMQDAEHA